MKTFIFSTHIKDVNFGHDINLSIYRVKNNIPTYLGFIKFNTQTSKGNKIEALNWLIDNSYLPKKCMVNDYINFDIVNKLFNIYEV